jgi:hypothetical protein
MNLHWTIENLAVSSQLDGKSDVVVSADWRLFAELEGIRCSSWGRVNFPPPDGDKFTAYENLTEAEILSWVWEIGANADSEFPWSREIAEQQAAAAIDAQRAAVTERPLPWIPPTPPQPERATLEQRTEALEMLVDYLLEGPTA